ncbi:MAG: hypothetical protein K2R93_06510 [Gemmatimonadaceae bacterium]|nr:hypothetical protein [Gemmatimonadaceae bacterium]
MNGFVVFPERADRKRFMKRPEIRDLARRTDSLICSSGPRHVVTFQGLSEQEVALIRTAAHETLGKVLSSFQFVVA